MWNFLKRRHPGDIRRLASAYRCLLKSARQAEIQGITDSEAVDTRKWRGGFGKAIQQLFHQWPTPAQSERFEKMMARQFRKTDEVDEAFLHAFNDYLGQKRLNPRELTDVRQQGEQDFGLPDPD